MFANFTEEARKIIVEAKNEMLQLKHPYVGSEHLLLSILKSKNNISKRLKDYNLNYQIFKDELVKIIGIGSKASEWLLYTPLLKRILENAVIDSKENNNNEVTVEHLFASMLEEGEGVAIRIMIGLNIDIDELYIEFGNRLTNHKNKKLILEDLGIDFTKKALNKEFDPVIGRDNEVKRIIEILCRRTKNNPLLIGEAGVGKTAIVEELSRLMATGQVPLVLKNKRLICLDMASTVAGTKYRGEFEERIQKILKEIEENDDIILFIDEIHTLVGAGGAEGAIDASNIFKPALSRGKIKCIGATTTLEYKKYIEQDKALERRFQKVTIEPPNNEQLKEILNNLKNIYENYHRVSISDEILNYIINLSNKYVYDRNQPDKAIDILDEVCSKVSLKETKELKEYKTLINKLQNIIKNKNEAIIKNDFQLASSYKDEENYYMDKINNLEIKLYQNNIKPVTKEDVAEVINIKTKIPVYELLDNQAITIKNLEKNITSKIFGQDEAISEIINITKKLKMGFKDDNKCYSMLFSGSSGVGKTELAKIFGECLVGIDNVIKLDMSEFRESHTVSKILGAPPGYVGYSDHKNILEEIRNKPYSVLIIDEIEKASEAVLNLFYQILDDGKIKDSTGKTIRFDNVIIIMTTNIGFNSIDIGFNKKNKTEVLTDLKESFNTAFINRIDNIVIFNKLNKEVINTIVEQKIKLLKKKYLNKNQTIKISKNIVDEIIDLCNFEDFGARKIDQIIKNRLESIIVENIINNQSNKLIKTVKT